MNIPNKNTIPTPVPPPEAEADITFPGVYLEKYKFRLSGEPGTTCRIRCLRGGRRSVSPLTGKAAQNAWHFELGSLRFAQTPRINVWSFTAALIEVLTGA
jgi:hypothetical protein